MEWGAKVRSEKTELNNNKIDAEIFHDINVFYWQGLQDIKELHWHSKVSGLVIATSHTGFDVFKTISV